MTTPEMHVMFRQYAQQMGMQNTRAILPEQIDLVLNTSQMDVLNQVIKENIGVTNDRVITDNSKIGQINALRSLYKVNLIDMTPSLSKSLNKEKRTFTFFKEDKNTGRMTTNFEKISNDTSIPDYLYLVDFSLNYQGIATKQGYTGDNTYNNSDVYSVLTVSGCNDNEKEYLFKDVPTSETITVNTFVPKEILSSAEGGGGDKYYQLPYKIIDNGTEYCLSNASTEIGNSDLYLGVEPYSDTNTNPRYVLTSSFATNKNPLIYHKKKSVGYKNPKLNGLSTTYFPVRIIDDAYLADTLNDFVLKPRLRTPIMVVYDNQFDLYIDKFQEIFDEDGNCSYVLDNNLLPHILRMSYIAKPAKIYYGEDLGKPNTNCELPEYMHMDIVKHAVDLWRLTISGSMLAAQKQEQNARQENMRNNYRNEGDAQQ